MALNAPPSSRKTITSLPALPSQNETLETLDIPRAMKVGSQRTNLSPIDAEERPQSDFVGATSTERPQSEFVRDSRKSQPQRRPRPTSQRPRSDARRKSSFRQSALSSFNPFGPIIFEGAVHDSEQEEDGSISPRQKWSQQQQEQEEHQTWWENDGQESPDEEKNPFDDPPAYEPSSARFDSVDVEKKGKDEEVKKPEADPAAAGKLTGWRLNVLTITLLAALFISVLEVSIVSTSLVIISNNLGSYTKSNWIVISYLLTYTGFLIIWAKASDVFGRKGTLCTAILTFVVFSAACGASQTVDQLIVCRAFQGIGGAGVYSMVMVIVPESAPPGKIAKYSAFLSIDFALAYLFGPLLGGGINNANAWRWVFFLNIPSGMLAFTALVLIMPMSFPHPPPTKKTNRLSLASIQSFDFANLKKQIARLDFLGATLLLAGSVFLVTALTQAGTSKDWGSVEVVVLLALSGVIWVAFGVWSWALSRVDWTVESIFPWRFVKSRPLMGVLLNTIFTGAPFTVAVISLPERFQTVNAVSPLQAGIRILPFALSAPIGSTLSSILVTKYNLFPWAIVLAGAVFQVLGSSLLSVASTDIITEASVYGYEVLLGFGLGMNIAAVMCVAPYLVERKHHAAAMGAVTQFRILGGALGLALATNILNTHVRSTLTDSPAITAEQVTLVLSSPGGFGEIPGEALEVVRAAFGDGYNLGMRAMVAFAGAQVPGALLLWGRRPEEGAMP